METNVSFEIFHPRPYTQKVDVYMLSKVKGHSSITGRLKKYGTLGYIQKFGSPVQSSDCSLQGSLTAYQLFLGDLPSAFQKNFVSTERNISGNLTITNTSLPSQYQYLGILTDEFLQNDTVFRLPFGSSSEVHILVENGTAYCFSLFNISEGNIISSTPLINVYISNATTTGNNCIEHWKRQSWNVGMYALH